MTEAFQGSMQETEETAGRKPASASALLSKNVRIHDKRTSVRLEPEMWSALKEIATIEACSIHDLCAAVHDMKEAGMSFTAALRVFLMEYYRTAARTSPRVNMVQRRLKSAVRSDMPDMPPPAGADDLARKVAG